VRLEKIARAKALDCDWPELSVVIPAALSSSTSSCRAPTRQSIDLHARAFPVGIESEGFPTAVA